MRTKDIKVSMEIPIPIDKPDENNVLYTEDAIINACKNADNLPIILYNLDGSTKVSGVTSKVKYKDGHILVDGYIFYGGVDGKIVFDDEKEIMSMEIIGFNID